jgi:hypothetical protein
MPLSSALNANFPRKLAFGVFVAVEAEVGTGWKVAAEIEAERPSESFEAGSWQALEPPPEESFRPAVPR